MDWQERFGARFLSLPPLGRLAVLLVVFVGLLLVWPQLERENLFAAGGPLAQARPLPGFPVEGGYWQGIAPQTPEGMRGHVWILKVWTFGCSNCVASIPYTNSLTRRWPTQVRVLGIHSPEFAWERERAGLTAALAQHSVAFPSYVDQDGAYFSRLRAGGWPLYVVVDRRGDIRGEWLGEVHQGTARAAALEELVESLL